MVTLFAFFLLLSVPGLLLSQDEAPMEWRTVYERSGYVKTARYDETVEYCKRLDTASASVRRGENCRWLFSPKITSSSLATRQQAAR